MNKVLVTGGAGYIGSHTCIELVQAGYRVVVFDNFSNSKRSVVDRLWQIAGAGIELVQGDVRDRTALDRAFAGQGISAVLHFAGFKAVGESVEKPLDYYDNNVYGTVALCQAMARHDVKTLVFSSSATVYGDPHALPVREDFPLKPASAYGNTKLVIEMLLRDLAVSNPVWRIGLLRYFNPVGAHESGLIGEDPNGIPNNLMPYISKVAAGSLDRVRIFGNDYPTPDGTGVRDYIHVVDLAQGHVAALRYLEAHSGVLTVNLGTGRGQSVMEVLRAYERASGRTIPFEVVGRRGGDVPEYYADPTLAAELLGWRAQRDIDAMCRDAWRWQSTAGNSRAEVVAAND